MKTRSMKDDFRPDTADGGRRTRGVQVKGASTLEEGNLLNLEMIQIVGIAYLSEVHDQGRK